MMEAAPGSRMMSRGRKAGLEPDEIVKQIQAEIYPDRADDKLARRCYALTIRGGFLPADFTGLYKRRRRKSRSHPCRAAA